MRKILSLLTIRSLFLLVVCLFINACGFSSYLSLKNINTSANNNSGKLNVLGPIQVGAERPTLYLPKLKGKRVGLVEPLAYLHVWRELGQGSSLFPDSGSHILNSKLRNEAVRKWVEDNPNFMTEDNLERWL